MTNHVNKFIVASTVHDPEFRLKTHLDEAMPLIKDLFVEQYICYTSPTSDELVQYLKREGFNATESETMKQIDTYTQVISNAVDQINNPALDFIFYIDFDRLIHWVLHFPKELKDVFLNFKGYDFLHIGRSKRAFATHPPTQQKTEYITNKIGSKAIGFSEIRDIISVCFIINKRLAEKIINMDHITTMGFYGTWPLVFWQWAETKEYIEVGGLEWETPDKYETEINDMGYDKWLSQFQSQEEWIKRTEMLEDCLSELLNLTDIEFLPEI
jgi:hypothetical protein